MLGRYVSPDYQMMERGRASKSILLQDFRINQTKNKQRRVKHSVLFISIVAMRYHYHCAWQLSDDFF